MHNSSDLYLYFHAALRRQKETEKVAKERVQLKKNTYNVGTLDELQYTLLSCIIIDD